MRILPTKAVKPGMRLGRSIFDPNGRLVIAAGITLQQKVLDLLARQGYSAVYIADSFSDVDLPDTVSFDTRQEVTRCVTELMKEEILASQRMALEMPFNPDRQKLGKVVIAKHRHEMTVRIAKAAEMLVNEVITNPEVIIGLVDVKSLHDYSFAHSVQVAVNSLVVGKMLGLKPTELRDLGTGALLHDIGKTAVSTSIWAKEGDLTPEEFERVQAHPEAGFEILRSTGMGLLPAHVAYQHHERWDGSGYPRGLKERDILKYARICAVCDVFDAMTSDRPYKKAIHPSIGLAFILENSGILFDPEVTEAFSRVTAPFPLATGVKLSTGETAIVKKLNPRALDRPIVVAVRSPGGEFYSTPRQMDLQNQIDITIVSYVDWYTAPADTGIKMVSRLAADTIQ